MTWRFFTENWPDARDLLCAYFPHAGDLVADLVRPQSVSDLAEVLHHLADRHDLTLLEAAELLDDLAMSAMAQARYVSDVTHKIVASS